HDMTEEERKAAFMKLFLPADDGVVDMEHGGHGAVPIELALTRREEIYKLFYKAFTADVVIITPGLAECWYDNQEQIYIQHMPPMRAMMADKDRFVFKRLRYPEAYDWVRKSIELINSLGTPNKRILITTSPVPINTTFTPEDVIISNTYSKSVLRAVSGDIYNDFENVDYFP